MTDPRWSEATADLVAEATEKHHILFNKTDAMGNSGCICNKWWDAAGDNPGWDQHMAEVALAALADAGLLVPPGAEVAKQWSVNWFDIETRQPMATSATNDRAEADRSLDDVGEVWGHHARLMTRNVISTPWNKVTS